MTFEEWARLWVSCGYDGLEIACWVDHFDPCAAVEDDSYIPAKLEVLERNGLKVYAISNHLKGQAVCDDPIDQRHRDMLPDRSEERRVGKECGAGRAREDGDEDEVT